VELGALGRTYDVSRSVAEVRVTVMNRLVILVPTRNRPALAQRAVESILEADPPNVVVMLSDNSTGAAHVDSLTRFVAQRGDPRIQLRRPPKAMPMTAHWNWALNEGIRCETVSHITVLTDRMMFKAGSLNTLLRLVERYPEKIITYDHDRVVDHRVPITVELNPWSDETLMLTAKRLLSLSAKCTFPSSLPRLLNSIVPRSFLENNIKAYGSIVGSLCPDYSFCYRALALIDDIVYWDRAPIFHYALGESNGESVSRGVVTEASSDFMSTAPGTLFRAAPCPSVRTVGNAMMHEYCVISGTSSGKEFPPVDIAMYTQMLRKEIDLMENRSVAIEMHRALSEWYTSVGQSQESQQAVARRGGVVRRIARQMRIGVLALRIRRLFTWSWPRIKQDNADPIFASLEEALEYASSTNGERVSPHRLTIYH
jgi:hypothetical protein